MTEVAGKLTFARLVESRLCLHPSAQFESHLGRATDLVEVRE